MLLEHQISRDFLRRRPAPKSSLFAVLALITDSATSSRERVPRSRKQLACGELRPTSWQLVATVAESVIKAAVLDRPQFVPPPRNT